MAAEGTSGGRSFQGEGIGTARMRAGGRGSVEARGAVPFAVTETLVPAAVLGRVITVYAAGVPASRPCCTSA